MIEVGVTSPVYHAVSKAWASSLSSRACDASLTWEAAGGDSLATLHLMRRLERALGRKVSFDVLYPEMRLHDLVALLESRDQTTVSGLPCVHLLPGRHGDEPRLASVRRALGGVVEFNNVPLAGLDETTATLQSIPRMGQLAADVIAAKQPQGSLLLAGYSMGGSIAFEAARSLEERGRRVDFLAILDAPFSTAEATRWRRFVKMARPTPLWRTTVRVASSWNPVRRAALALLDRCFPPTAQVARRYLVTLFREHARHCWAPAPLEVNVFLAVSDQLAPRTLRTWRRLCRRLLIVELPGAHLDIFQRPAADILLPAFMQAVQDTRSLPLQTQPAI